MSFMFAIYFKGRYTKTHYDRSDRSRVRIRDLLGISTHMSRRMSDPSVSISKQGRRGHVSRFLTRPKALEGCKH